MKNAKFYIISFLSIMILIEVFSYIALNIINKKSSFSNYINIPDLSKDIKKYSEFIPYSRNKINFNELNNYIIKEDENYFYSIIKSFNENNNENILIQGDSWAEIAQNEEIYRFLKNVSQSKKLVMINAGISSYSPSPMTSQLFILKKEFNINPTILIATIDQTDIGDEIYRYRSLNQKSLSPTLTKLHIKFFEEVKKSFDSSNLSVFKLIQYMNLYFSLHKDIYKLGNLDTIKIITKKVRAKIFRMPIVLSPLRFGINEFEKDIVMKKINNYINIASKNKKLKKIYFVTHPHLNHLQKFGGKYVLNIADIIDEVILISPHSKLLNHINFSKLETSIDLNLFLKEDEFSHLTVDAYKNYYWPTIFDEIDLK